MVHAERRAVRPNLHQLVAVALLGAALGASAVPVGAQEVIEGRAILAHPAGRAIVEAGKLLAAGKLAEVKKSSAKEVREEWAALSAEDQRTEAAAAAESAPDAKTLAAEIARSGILTNYGDSAMLRTASEDGNSSIMAFVSLEAGKWLVTAGPKIIDTTPVVETAPAIEGAAILEHEIGKVALAYAEKIAAGKFDAATELLSGAARAKRAAGSAKERQESDDFRRSTLPPAQQFADQIRSGGRLSFEGEKAYLSVSYNETTKNADGSITSSSTSYSLPFELDQGKWRVGGE